MKLSYLALAATLLLAACASKDDKAKLAELRKERTTLDAQIAELEAKVDTGDNLRVRQVVLTPLAAETFTHYLEVQGSVEAEDNIMVTPKTGGTITRVLVTEGDRVSAGQTIALIDNAIISKALAQAKTGYNLAQELYNRQKALWDQQIGTEVAYLQAKTQYEAAKEQVAQLQEQVANTRIAAPISGSVDAVMVKVGDAVAPGVPLARVVNSSRLKAFANVAESYAGRVQPGTPVKVYFPDLKKDVEGKINFATSSIDPSSRTFRVQVDLPSKPEYRPNMVAVLRIQDAKIAEAITVPVGVVTNTDQGAYVYVAAEKNGKMLAERRPITTGLTYQGMIEVKSGLKPGDQLVTVGYQDVNEGDLLKNTPPQASTR